MRVVLTTFPDEAAASEAVLTLISEGLAACGTLVPGARSIYRWQGKIEEAVETLVVFKLAAGDLRAFTARLTELHPYEVPEIIALKPDSVAPAYAAWVCGKTDAGQA